jgi:hypothetical protein
MSFLTQVMLEAEDTSAMDLIAREPALQAIMREEGLRAAMQAAARQADSRRVPVHQGPMRPEDVRQEPMRQADSDLASLVVADSGRVVRTNNNLGRLDRSANHPNGPGEAGPVRTAARGGSSTQVGGDLITNNTPGRPSVSMIGRSRPTKPIQSGKSKIVPEPDQIQSPPPGRRRSSLLEPPGS